MRRDRVEASLMAELELAYDKGYADGAKFGNDLPAVKLPYGRGQLGWSATRLYQFGFAEGREHRNTSLGRAALKAMAEREAEADRRIEVEGYGTPATMTQLRVMVNEKRDTP